ncbi:hypothetical protein BZL30_7126 [Mycobacterium kansasii]|uniref:Uncharacterized protein n=1 Tax=Mycobacterium kansasii TaxID=1768 RepID=A0A1V3WQG9_MYCKA|nr:hypothetical protein BZL30_7126 [Mycobacterium kansasii]
MAGSAGRDLGGPRAAAYLRRAQGVEVVDCGDLASGVDIDEPL